MTHPPLHIAIVDDALIDRNLIRRALAKGLQQSFVCHEGAKGADALTLCRELPHTSTKPVDVLLLDMRLPDIDGVEVLRLLKGDQAILPLPIVMLTGSPREAEIQTALAAGAQDFIPKGQLTPENLTRAVLNAIERFRLVKNLQASEEHSRQQLADLQTIYAAAPVGLAVLDRELRYLRINEYLAEINGLPVAAHIGHKLRDILPNIADTFETQLHHVLETGEPFVNLEMNGFTKTQPGVKRSWLGSFYPLQDEDGAVHGINCILYEVTGRKQAEEALHQSEERYRRLVEDQNDLICRFQPDLRLTFINQAYSTSLNKRPEEIIGKTLFEFIPTEHHAPILAHLATLTPAQPTSNYENPVLLPDGTFRWYQWTDRLITDEAGQTLEYQAVGRDVTERRRAELAEREQRLLAEALRDSMVALTSSNDGEQVMQQILTAAARVVPSEGGSIILFEGEQSRVAYLRGFPPGAEAFFQDYRFPTDALTRNRILAEKQTYFIADTHTAENWQRLPFAEWIRSSLGVPIDLHGELIGLLVVDSAVPNHFSAADIDNLSTFAHYASLALEKVEYVSKLEARVVERTAELQAEKERVEAILNHSPDSILLIQPDLSIQQTNVAFETLFGHKPYTCCGQSLQAILYPDDLPRVQALIQTAIQGQVGQPIEVYACRCDNTVFDAELSIGPLRDGSFVCTIRDITERKRSQSALAEERNLLRTLIDAIPDLIYVKDMEHRFVLRNTFAERVLHRMSTAEIIGATDAEFLPPALAAQLHADEGKIFHTGQPLLNQEIELTMPGGQFFWISTTKVPLRNLNGEMIGLAGVSRNITQQKEYERQLRYYASLQGAVRDAVIASDLEMRIQSWNQAAETIYGWRAAEVIGKNASEILHTNNTVVERERARQELITQGYRLEEVVQQRKDETEIDILSSVSLLKDAYGEPFGIVAVNHDITQQKRAEEALRTSEEKFRLLVGAAPIAIIITDQQGKITLINHQASEIFGYQSPELLGQPIELLVPEAAKRAHTAHRRAYQSAPRVRQMGNGLDLTAQRKDGSQFPVEIELSYLETATGLNVICFILDITERKRTQEVLREQRDFLQVVIDMVPHLIMVKDSKGRFQLANQSAAQVYNIMPAEMVGKSDADLNANPGQVAFFRQKDQEVLQGAQPVFIPEQAILDRYYQTSKIPLKNSAGQTDRLLIVSSDITASRQTEAALQQALKREKELGELKSRFVSMASHEFRTPLAAIRATAETLYTYRHKLPDEQIGKRLSKIQEQVDYLKGIIEDVMQLTRLQARRVEFAPALLNLNALCHEVLEELQNQFNQAAPIQYVEDPMLSAVQLDKKLMRQIINNLVANALKYSPEDKAVYVNLSADSEMIHFTVQDQGIGIPEADLPHLFEPFHRAANVGNISGTGLGLTITKESVEMHGGTLALESQIGVGTTVKVKIPRVIDDGQAE